MTQIIMQWCFAFIKIWQQRLGVERKIDHDAITVEKKLSFRSSDEKKRMECKFQWMIVSVFKVERVFVSMYDTWYIKPEYYYSFEWSKTFPLSLVDLLLLSSHKSWYTGFHQT